ncbi:MAG: SusC/RagA family TonB-linked outer membrane protein [Bacteroidota bacterium]
MNFATTIKPLLRTIAVLLLWSICSNPARGDTEKEYFIMEEGQPLSEVLDELGEKYQVFFSYNIDLLMNVTVDFTYSEGESLEQAMDRLLVNTNFTYETYGQKYFVVFEKTKKGIRDAKKLKRNVKRIHKLENKGNINVSPTSGESINKIRETVDYVTSKTMEKTLRGKVVNEEGEPLVGASIRAKGTTRGALTNEQGEFVLNVPEEVETLFISYFGYARQEVEIGDGAYFDIVMSESTSTLGEVVMLGYISKNRSDVTSSVASVDIENMAKRSTSDVTQALQGNVTGVQIYATDQSPGAAFNFNIRGISSPQGSVGSPPLVIVDGVQISGIQSVSYENVVGVGDGIRQTTGLENLNPNDIESIEILKDASAAAIYGSRAANGVVLITTKRGSVGKPQVNLNISVGTQVPFNGPEVANTEEYIQIMQGMYGDDLSGAELVPQAALDYLANPAQFSSYDWYDLVYNDAFTQTYDLSVAGGGDYGSYRISTGYKNQDGIALGTNFQRINIRANSDFNISDKIKVGQSLALSRAETDPEPYAFSRSVYYKAIAQVPYFSPYGVNPNPANDPSAPPRTRSFYWGGGDNPEALIRNPLDYQNFWSRDNDQDNVQANLYLQYEIIDGLSFKTSGSFNQTDAKIFTRTRTMSQPQEYFDCERCIEEIQSRDANWIFENTLSYSKQFGKHKVNALVGYIAQEFSSRLLSGSKANFLSDITSTLDGPGANPLFNTISGSNSKNRLASLVSQAFYSFDNKYQITLNFRRDGSSSFDPSVRWGNFPGISAAWRISNENFWSKWGFNSLFSDLKIRAGYGILGRQNSGVYPPQATLSFIPYSFGGNLANGLITPGPINTLITWEESKTTNVGLEFGILNDRLSGAIEYFERKTDKLLSGLVIPGSAGGGEISRNDGLIENTGVELGLNYQQSIKEFTFSIGLNATYVNTILTQIPENIIFGEAPEWDVPHVIQIFEGRGPSEFWLIKTDGIFRSQEEVNAHVGPNGELIQPSAQPGDIRFVDFNGDGEITTEGDRQFAGRGRAPWSGGLNFNAAYKAFDFSMNFYGIFGHHVFNGPQYLIEQPYGFDNFSSNLLNAFDPVTNPNSSLPRNNPNDINENWNSNPATDRYLEKGDFIKAALIELGYTLPRNFVEKLDLSSARISISTQNLFTITGYSGIDPEQGRDGWLSAGIDRGTTPQYRSFLLNVGLNF